ncbi:hypothetical protein WN944_001038 [Citrus x changshan-huyou]|uniref:Uncharacterized protein n=1 Tax=Citrus x changshan-huyou TaxID=2935761 RepID=A0AAP0QUE4_9ROSI
MLQTGVPGVTSRSLRLQRAGRFTGEAPSGAVSATVSNSPSPLSQPPSQPSQPPLPAPAEQMSNAMSDNVEINSSSVPVLSRNVED